MRLSPSALIHPAGSVAALFKLDTTKNRLGASNSLKGLDELVHRCAVNGFANDIGVPGIS
jgi:hypothetical protein